MYNCCANSTFSPTIRKTFSFASPTAFIFYCFLDNRHSNWSKNITHCSGIGLHFFVISDVNFSWHCVSVPVQAHTCTCVQMWVMGIEFRPLGLQQVFLHSEPSCPFLNSFYIVADHLYVLKYPDHFSISFIVVETDYTLGCHSVSELHLICSPITSLDYKHYWCLLLFYIYSEY